MRYQDIIIKVKAKGNLHALSQITGIPMDKIKPDTCINIYCQGNKIRDWAFADTGGKGFWASLFS